MSTAPAKFRPSSFEANALCPGRWVMNKGRKQSPSKSAARGTALHEASERVLQGESMGAHVSGEDCALVNAYVDALPKAQGVGSLFQLKKLDSVGLAEYEVNYATAIGCAPQDGRGTADYVFVSKDPNSGVGKDRAFAIEVHDLKTGGVEVLAKNNAQLMLYAAGVVTELKAYYPKRLIGTIKLLIHQPALKTTPDVYELGYNELQEWLTNFARPAVAKQLEAEKDQSSATWHAKYLTPNEKSCRWCLAKADCPALRNKTYEVITMFSPVVAGKEDKQLAIKEAVRAASAESVAKLLDSAPLVEMCLSAARTEAMARLHNGQEVPGYKLIEGRAGNRKWADENNAALKLMEHGVPESVVFSKVVKTPAGLENALKSFGMASDVKELTEKLVVREPSKPQLVTSDNPKPAISTTPVEVLMPIVETT